MHAMQQPMICPIVSTSPRSQLRPRAVRSLAAATLRSELPFWTGYQLALAVPSERAKYRKATHTFCVGSQRVALCGGRQMALEFAIVRVEADACTWQESPRSFAA